MAPARFHSGFPIRVSLGFPQISLGGPGLGRWAGLRLGKVLSGFVLLAAIRALLLEANLARPEDKR